jgi:hypothetical protein
MGVLVSKICGVRCPDCGWGMNGYYYSFENLETQKCGNCGGKLETVSGYTKNSGVLFGGWSDDPTSDLYIRADKDHPNERARREKRDYHIIEGLESEGKTPRLKDVTGQSDFASAKRRIRRYETEDRQR